MPVFKNSKAQDNLSNGDVLAGKAVSLLSRVNMGSQDQYSKTPTVVNKTEYIDNFIKLLSDLDNDIDLLNAQIHEGKLKGGGRNDKRFHLSFPEPWATSDTGDYYKMLLGGSSSHPLQEDSDEEELDDEGFPINPNVYIPANADKEAPGRMVDDEYVQKADLTVSGIIKTLANISKELSNAYLYFDAKIKPLLGDYSYPELSKIVLLFHQLTQKLDKFLSGEHRDIPTPLISTIKQKFDELKTLVITNINRFSGHFDIEKKDTIKKIGGRTNFIPMGFNKDRHQMSQKYLM